MTQQELAAIKLQLQEQRITYWEQHGYIPGCGALSYIVDRHQELIM